MGVDHRYRSRIHATRKKIATGRSPGFMAEVIGAGTPCKCIGTVEANILGHHDVVMNRQCGHHGKQDGGVHRILPKVMRRIFERRWTVRSQICRPGSKNGEVKWPAYANDTNVSSFVSERGIACLTLSCAGTRNWNAEHWLFEANGSHLALDGKVAIGFRSGAERIQNPIAIKVTYQVTEATTRYMPV